MTIVILKRGVNILRKRAPTLLKKMLTFLGSWFLAFLGLGLVVFFTVFVCRLSGEFSTTEGELLTGNHSVAVVELSGEIMNIAEVRKNFERYLDAENIRAIVVRIDSPGGTVGASEELYRLIKSAQAKKPIVCSLGNFAASGGLYVSMGCNKIVTLSGTITGSIGVLFIMPNVGELMRRFGVEMTVIKSGPYKDSGLPFRSLEADEQQVLQALVNQTYEQFITVVSEARKIPIDRVRAFADGRVILGESAVKLGLADEIGGLERAAKLALEQTGDMSEPDIIFPRRKHGIFSYLTEVGEARLRGYFDSATHGRLLYR